MKHSGFSMVELIVFILVIGLISAILIPSTRTLSGSAQGNTHLRALQLARGRMELILAAKRFDGFSDYSDPCAAGSPPAACTLPSGYSIATPTVASSWDGDSNYNLITVAVTGEGSATLTAIVSNS